MFAEGNWIWKPRCFEGGVWILTSTLILKSPIRILLPQLFQFCPPENGYFLRVERAKCFRMVWFEMVWIYWNEGWTIERRSCGGLPSKLQLLQPDLLQEVPSHVSFVDTICQVLWKNQKWLHQLNWGKTCLARMLLKRSTKRSEMGMTQKTFLDPKSQSEAFFIRGNNKGGGWCHNAKDNRLVRRTECERDAWKVVSSKSIIAKRKLACGPNLNPTILFIPPYVSQNLTWDRLTFNISMDSAMLHDQHLIYMDPWHSRQGNTGEKNLNFPSMKPCFCCSIQFLVTFWHLLFSWPFSN